MRHALLCLFAGYAFLGVAHIALLPPWEGFDEAQHYSYIQQVADRWEVPRLGPARLSRDVEDYTLWAPMKYSNKPPMEQNNGVTYREFFAAPAADRARGAATVHGRPAEPRRFEPSERWNWEAQHPPLYYALLAPVYRATRHLSWGAHLASLRLASYLLAWLALVLAGWACLHGYPSSWGNAAGRGWAALGVGVWPLVFPGWFPEMARLGNDSLCVLLMVAIWLVTLRALDRGASVGHSCVLGVLFGLAWVTKALFVPVTAGLLLFWCVHQYRRAGRRGLLGALRHGLVVGVWIALIAGWWYVGNLERYGVPLGSVEQIRLRAEGGLLSGLGRSFTVAEYVRGGLSFATRLAWPSTWSLARPSGIYLAPLGVLVLVAAGAYLFALWRARLGPVGQLPAWLLAPVLVGFGYHILVRIALTGEGRGTGGYYLHFLVAPLGVALGQSLGTWWPSAVFRRTMAALALYTMLFAVAISWAQVMLFAGVLFKEGYSKLYQAPPTLPVLFGIPEALSRLGAIAYPGIGSVAWILGGALVLCGAGLAWRAAGRLPRIADRPSPGESAF